MRVRRRLDRVHTAAALLTRKRSALVQELVHTAGPVLDAREAIERQAAVAYAALWHAEADRGHALLSALSVPTRELGVELRATQIWGLAGAEILGHDPVRRPAEARGVAVASAGPAATAAAEQFEGLTALLLDSASRELLIRRLVRSLAETSRRRNLLEHRVGPGLASEKHRIESTLEEREREEQLRYRRLLALPSSGRRR
jgi:H(+)-transporting ATP synthase subunit D